MPDHVHALVAFDNFVAMSSIIRDWKRFHTRRNQVRWQDGYFDHRLRNEREQLDQQVEYILSNPFVKGLCAQDDNWPWVINNLG